MATKLIEIGEVHNALAAKVRRHELELTDLRKAAGIVADWLERSHQINPADMVSRNLLLAKELRAAAMPNEKS